MEQRRSKLFLTLVLLATLMSMGLVFVGSFNITKPISQPISLAEVVSPTPTPDLNKSVDVPSPDGKYTLTMRSIATSAALIDQKFYITNESDKSGVEIYDKESAKGNLLSIPYNTFSPNDSYIFLKYIDTEGVKHIVLRTDGNDIRTGEKAVEIESNFYAKYPDFVITDVTGWGGNLLIVVNTDYKDGKIGPSWWFDLSNLSFIRLSTRFN